MIYSTIFSLILSATLFTHSPDGQKLLEQYQTLKSSVINQRGLAPGDKETILELRNEMSAWTDEHEDFQVIAAELQLSIWLDEVEKCNILFQYLSDLQPDNSAVGLAWGQFLLSQDGSDADVVYGKLVGQFPNSSEVILQWRSL